MKERPILFNGEMVRAILDGRKTQTRRVVKWKTRPGQEGLNLGFSGLESGYYCGGVASSGWVLRSRGQNSCWNDRTYPIHCPYGVPGDRLWVRETFCPLTVGYGYRADGFYNFAPGERWMPSIHMPRRASRITLEVTDVRVQRVQEISEEDAAAEGVDPTDEHKSSRQRFRRLWDSINAERGYGWDTNPWVWAVTFQRAASPEESRP